MTRYLMNTPNQKLRNLPKGDSLVFGLFIFNDAWLRYINECTRSMM